MIKDLHENYMDQPHEVSIETQSICNAACTFCPYPTIERKGNKMSDELLDRLMGEMEDFDKPFYFSPFKLSDPLLDKRLYSILKRMDKTKAVMRVFTNGSALTEERCEEIADIYHIAHLWISLNYHDHEEYQKHMGIPQDRVLKRLDWLHTKEFPHRVVVSKVGDDPEFIKFVRDRWPDFEARIIKKDAWIDFTDPENTEIPDSPCSRWFELSVISDGRVMHCCMDSGDYPIGDLNNQSLLEVYNSPIWRERREGLMNRKDLPDNYPCNRCSY